MPRRSPSPLSSAEPAVLVSEVRTSAMTEPVKIRINNPQNRTIRPRFIIPPGFFRCAWRYTARVDQTQQLRVGQVTGALDPRIMQFALKYFF